MILAHYTLHICYSPQSTVCRGGRGSGPVLPVPAETCGSTLPDIPSPAQCCIKGGEMHDKTLAKLNSNKSEVANSSKDVLSTDVFSVDVTLTCAPGAAATERIG